MTDRRTRHRLIACQPGTSYEMGCPGHHSDDVRRASVAGDERGAASVIIVGFAVVLAMTIAVVVDASAAYLRRSSLDTLADGAALRGADLGATGVEVYAGGVPPEQLALTTAQARAAVASYLAQVGAYSRFPGLAYRVTVDGDDRTVRVHLTAPLDLPLTVPGSPGTASIGADGAAVVGVDP